MKFPMALAVLAGALVLAGGGEAREKREEPDALKGDAKAAQWFRDARFGMFVHWGVYSLLGRGEWVMQNEGIPISEYEKLPPRFDPTEFNAREWVKMVKASGIRYITITSKHHDGFCMFDSKLTDYDIVDRTPYHRDVMKELADECHRQRIKLFFYYSQLDWHHPDYFPRGGTGHKSGRPEAGDWNRYKQYYIGQVRELCTNYGEIGGIWFDGWWDKPGADWGHDELYSMIHRLQPKALIGNNHHRAPFPGEDFQMFEQDLPGENSAGFNTTQQSHLPYETCRTMNNSWGLNTSDKAHKPVNELIRYLVQAAGRDANLLLNTGPLPTGEILPEHRERYLAMGQWLKTHGHSIYRTRGGPFRPASWGVSTYRGKRVFLHVLNWPAGNTLDLSGFTLPVRSARAFGEERTPVEVRQSAEGVKLVLPEGLKDPVDSIIVLELEKPVAEWTPVAAPPAKISSSGPSALPARSAETTGLAHYEADKDCIGYWTQPGDTVSWKASVEQAGRYEVGVTYACEKGAGGSEFTVACGREKVAGVVRETGSWTEFRTVSLGTVEVPAGTQTLTVSAQKMPGFAVMNLRGITLRPVP